VFPLSATSVLSLNLRIDRRPNFLQNAFSVRAIPEAYADDHRSHRTNDKRFLNNLRIRCGRTGDEDDFYDEEHERDHRLFDVSEGLGNQPSYWATALQESFRGSSRSASFSMIRNSRLFMLIRLVILDYLMLNTYRGLDNFMIEYCGIDREKASIDIPPVNMPCADGPQMSEIPNPNPATSRIFDPPAAIPSISAPGARAPGPSTPNRRQSHIHTAAIDNSLSFPTNIHAVGGQTLTDGYTSP